MTHTKITMTPRETSLADALGHLAVDYRLTNPGFADGAGNLLQAEAVLDEAAGYAESRALREGWWLRPDDGGRVDIRCWPEDPEEHLDGSDALAVIHVSCLARDGSTRHVEALRLAGRTLNGPTADADESNDRTTSRRRMMAALAAEADTAGYLAFDEPAAAAGTGTMRFSRPSDRATAVTLEYHFGPDRLTARLRARDGALHPMAPIPCGGAPGDWSLDLGDAHHRSALVHQVMTSLAADPGDPGPRDWQHIITAAYETEAGSSPGGDHRQLIGTLSAQLAASDVDDGDAAADLRLWSRILANAASRDGAA